MSRLLFYVQYLKGIGHLQRACLIAEACARRGLHVDLLSGGLPVPDLVPEGCNVHQLPALKAGPDGWRDLRDTAGRTVDQGWLDARRDYVLDLFDACRPDALVVEAFPFGRRQFAFELLPLLEAAKARTPRPVTVCSVRDILQVSPKPGRAEETAERLETYFDAVLAHGDPSFAALSETFPCADRIASMTHHTGLVAAAPDAFTPDESTPQGEVVVSIGAGALGSDLLLAALAARPMTTLAEAPWRLLAGPNLPEAELVRLRDALPPSVTLERFRTDFRRLLAAARLSISFAGYNTVSDIMRAGTHAVLITYQAGGGETEQTERARRMSARGLAVTLPDDALTGESLARAVDAAVALPPPREAAFNLAGAERTAELLAGWARQNG